MRVHVQPHVRDSHVDSVDLEDVALLRPSPDVTPFFSLGSSSELHRVHFVLSTWESYSLDDSSLPDIDVMLTRHRCPSLGRERVVLSRGMQSSSISHDWRSTIRERCVGELLRASEGFIFLVV